MTNIIKPSSDSSSSSNDGDRSENTFIFHLVCPQKHLTMNDKANSGEANGSSLSTSSNTNNLSLDAFPNTTGTTSSSTTMPSPTVTWNQFNQLNIQTGPDNLLMQQSYQMLMNQYYQYMSYYFLSSPPIDFVSYAAFTNAYMQSIQPVNDQQFSNSIGTSNINVTTVPNNSNNNNNLNNNRINQPQPQAAAAAVIDNDDVLVNRDWTDWMYSFSKAVIMLSIIYLYSSLNRLVLFMSIFLIIYFYKNLLNGLNPANNGGGGGNNNDIRINNDRNNNHPMNNNEQRINQANINDDSLNPENNNHQQQDDENNSRYYSGLRFVWMFITSLFTSLIPDPVPIN